MKKKEKNAKHEQKFTKKRIVITVIAILLIIPIAVITHYIGLIGHVGEVEPVDPDNEYFETDPNAAGESLDPDSVKWDTFEALGDEHLLNLLIVGQDKREGQGRQRSDVMMLCSVNLETENISLISFMRDLYVQIPGYSDNRLNAAYAFGGFELLKKTLYKNFGITIDGCFEFDFDGFIKAIDIIGGVDITLTRSEASALGFSYKGDSPVHLNGKKALEYARLRKIDSDFARTERQRKVVLAVADKFKNSGFKEIMDIVNTVLPHITTDMSTVGIYSLVTKAVPLMSSSQTKTFSVPASGTYKNAVIRGMMVLVPDLAAIRKELRENMMPF